MDILYLQPPTFDSSPLTKVKELTLPNGNYEGELKDNTRNGLGIFLWHNGDAYYGSWLDDKMHGKGIFCYNTGHCIEGTFNANFIDGPACLIYPNKSYTKGVFSNGELNGRSLFYYADKNSWALQDYQLGKLKGIYYEGKGKPMSYDFSITAFGEGFGVPTTKAGEANESCYKILALKKELANSYSVGCFELEDGSKHFGIMRNCKIEGLGIRVLDKSIEIGKYRENSLDGNGRRLEFGTRLYEGEFIQGKYYGKGTLCEWKNKVIMTTNGIFTNGIIMHKFNEEIFSLHVWNDFCLTNAGESKVINLNVRNYEDAFDKSYTESDSKDEDSKLIATTIKEISHAKIVSRETLIEYHEMSKESNPNPVSIDSIQNSPSRRALLETASHLAKMVNAVNNDPYDVTTTLQASQGYIDRLKKRLDDQEGVQNSKRSKSTERDLEPAFSQVFSVCVDDKPSTQRSFRSASRDTARYGNITFNHPYEQVGLDNQARLETLKNFSSASLNKLDNTTYKDYETAANFTSKAEELASGGNYWYNKEPYNSGLNINYDSFGVSESAKLSNLEVSPLLSAAPKTTENEIHSASLQDQPRTLVRCQKNSRSSAELHVPVEVTLKNNPEKVVKTLTYTGTREPSPSRRVLTVNTKKVSSEKSPLALQSSHGTAISSGKFPIDSARAPSKNSTNAPSRNKIPAMIRANSPSQSLNKKSCTSDMKSSKYPSLKDKNLISSSKPPQSEATSLVYVGSAPYLKKAIVASTVKQEVLKKPKDPRIAITPSIQDRRSFTTSGESHEFIARRSERVRAESPAQVVEVDLHSHFLNPKGGNQKKYDEKTALIGYTLPEKSLSSTINTWSAHKTVYLTDEHSYAGEGSTQKTFLTERNSAGKQSARNSARNKSPLLSNVVSIDISMFRTGTTCLVSDFDVNKPSPGKAKSGLNHSPISYTDNKSSFISGGLDYELNQAGEGYRIADRVRETEKLNSTGYTFMPAKGILEALGSRGETKDLFKSNISGVDYTTGINGMISREENNPLVLNLALTNTPQSLTDKNAQIIPVYTYDRGNKTLIEATGLERNISQIEISETEKHKFIPGYSAKTPSFSLTNQKDLKFGTDADLETPKKGSRYDEFPLESRSQNTVNSARRASEDEIVNSPERVKVESPYKIDSQRQRLNNPVKEPTQDKNSVNSPSRGCGSPTKHCHGHDSFDSGYYPIKKTCYLNSDCNCCESLGSGKGSSQRSSQRGSPVRHPRSLTLSNVTSPERLKNHQQQSDNIKIVSNQGISQIPETISIGLSSNLGDGIYSMLRETRSTDDYKLDINALPTVSSKYEHIKDDYLYQPPQISSSIKVVETSLEKQGIFQSSQPSSKAASTANFGFRSGPTTPQVDFDITANYPGIYRQPIEDPKNDMPDFFSYQSKNFASRPGVKRPQLMADPKIAVAPVNNDHEYNYVRNDYVHEIPSETYKNSPVKTKDGELISNRSSMGAVFSARSSVKEEWGSIKEVQSLHSVQFGFGVNDLTKFALNPQHHQHVQIKRLPEDVRIALMSKSHYDTKGYQVKQREEIDHTFGSAVAKFNAEKSFKPPKEMQRSKSLNKFQNRSGGMNKQQRHNIADEDDISEEKNDNLRQDLGSERKTETKRASAHNDFSGASLKKMK